MWPFNKQKVKTKKENMREQQKAGVLLDGLLDGEMQTLPLVKTSQHSEKDQEISDVTMHT